MTDHDSVQFCRERDHYNSLSHSADIVNALYLYSQTGSPKLLMRDLCEALEIDGYYNLIDDAFKLTSPRSPVSVYHLRVRLKLNHISDLAATDWMTACDWATQVHLRSTSGYEFFKLQQFRSNLAGLHMCRADADLLLAELNGPIVTRDPFFLFIRSKLGFMPSYFSVATKRLYAEALNAAVARTKATHKMIQRTVI